MVFPSVRKSVVCMPVVLAVLLYLQAAPPSTPSPQQIAIQRDVAATKMTPAVWLRRYDAIVALTAVTVQERQFLANAILHASNSPLDSTERSRLDELLNRICARQIRAATEVALLPDIAEMRTLRHDYTLYVLAVAALCLDTSLSIEALRVKDEYGNYCVLRALLQRKACLDQIGLYCETLASKSRISLLRSHVEVQ